MEPTSDKGGELSPLPAAPSAAPVIYADFDAPPDLDPIAFDFRRLNGKLPAITAGTVYFWPLDTADSRKAVAKHAAALHKRGVACRILEAAAPTSDADVTSALSASKPVLNKAAARKAAAEAEGERPSYLIWQDWGLAANERGPYPTEANALQILGHAPKFTGRIWLDEFSQRLMIDDESARHGCRLFSRTDAITALVWMQSELQLPKMGLAAVERAALLIGERQKRHPVKEWFDTLEWDGVERLPTLLADGWGAEQNEYTQAVGTNWLIGMVARVYEPGCKLDNIVIIEGLSGIAKSSGLRALVGDQWFVESSINPVRKMNDFLQATQGALLMEVPEIDRYLRGESIRDMVALASMQYDIYRAPYAPNTMQYPRQCVICGTTNKSQLYDDTDGMRRWWAFIAKFLNLEYIKTNKKLLWAEAIVRYKRGETWWNVPDDLARAEQIARRNRDEWEAVIEQYVTHEPSRWKDKIGVTWTQRSAPLPHVTTSELLEHALGIDPSKWTQPDQRRVSAACQSFGWKSIIARVNGRATRVWKVPESEQKTSVAPKTSVDDDVPY